MKKDKQIARYSDEIKHIDKWIEILKKDREDLKKNKDLTEGELKSKENNINRTIKRLIELSKEIQKTIDDINQKFGKSIVAPASLKIIGEPKSKRNLKK